MKKISAVVTLLMMSGVAQGAAINGTFNVFSPDGSEVADSGHPITGSIGNGIWSINPANSILFSTSSYHDGTTFGSGTYEIDTIEGGTYNFTVGAGQIGGHILWDWSVAAGPTKDMDIINIWDISTLNGATIYTSTDIDGDGIPGVGMIDGTFSQIPFSANFNFSTVVPVPSAVWLFCSGLLGLVGLSRKK